MILITRATADYIRNEIKRPDLVKHTIGKGKKKTYYAVEEPWLMRKLNLNEKR